MNVTPATNNITITERIVNIWSEKLYLFKST